ncbi:MAG: hypothetical protein HXY39_08715 [Chloroflexi bacterium]|nr:hypothetical protein [Chloroflexota bacterium]
MREQWADTTGESAVSGGQDVVIESVEVFDPAPDPEVTPGDVIALLVAHFEESLIRKEHELIALRRSIEESERTAAELQQTLQQELDTVNHIGRILERENQRLQAEVEALRRQLDEITIQDETLQVLHALERENQRLQAEVEALRREAQQHPLPADDLLLEALLEREVGASPAEPARTPSSPARRFRRRPITM